jgi:hypothetical protein
VSCKKKKPALPTIIPKSLPHVDRQIIITITHEKLTNDTERQKTAVSALDYLNYAIRTTAKIDQLPFILARITSNNKLVLMTNPTTPATAYTPYMPMLINGIKPLNPTSGQMNSCWTKFLVHNVPTDAALDSVRHEIERTYPTLQLMQDPRWLVPTERCLNKTSSTIIISLHGAIDLTCLGIS